jgi:5-methylcytosine-specific restriction endonuclease McrA
MPPITPSLTHLSNRELLAEVQRLAACERQATAHLIASLMEVDARRLYLGEGCSSLFTYCTQVLHLSEHAAYGRIEAARAARRFPEILELLAAGNLTLTAIGLLAPHLTPDNHVEVLDTARHKSKREVEHLIARIHPRPDVPPVVRKLPAAKSLVPPPALTSDSAPVPGTDVATPHTRHGEDDQASRPSRMLAVVAPLAPERYRVQFTVGRDTYEKLRRAQDLLRHTIPSGDPSAIFDRALTLLVTELERTRLASTKRPRCTRPTPAASRHIPAAVRRAVWTRDAGRCAFVGTLGRCTETGFLEFHHVMPYARGGSAIVDNIELRCASHNAHEAELFFGPREPALVRETGPPYALV